MSRSSAGAAIGAAVFAVIAPGGVAGLVPYLLTGWLPEGAFLGLEATRWLGLPFLVAGLTALVDSFARFVRDGFGTPAPVAPPSRLVVRGLYRRVRNPMYLAVLSVVLGQALLLGSARLLVYAALLALVLHAFVVLYEEPALRRRFDGDYDWYLARVPRWIPRI